MKRIAFTITLECRDDVPPHVIEWMGDNLLEHALHEFDCDFEPEFVQPTYDKRPIAGDGEWDVSIAEVERAR